jgi:3-deoxy-D-manno-octulosonic-acid transferase
VTLVNARLSPRSERRFRKARFWISPIFGLIDRICLPEQADLARWQDLGISTERFAVTGSIKFDSPDETTTSRAGEFRTLFDSLGIKPNARILVAGSTWAPEEKIITRILLNLRDEFPDLFLIIAPRHVERTADILRDLASLDVQMIRRSTLPLAAPAACDLLLVDTTGELCDWYALATVVFIGKSLPGVAEVGGQNPAEPAALGKPLVFGPHMENFTGLVDLLRSNNAAITAADAAGLTQAIRALLQDPARCEAMGRRARAALVPHRGATARTADLLLTARNADPLLPPLSVPS